ncbi:Zinc finger, RING-type [Dillenia turbinata]|uniref:RING-type E3 ubiquitin transferase n=1 Tax=Dillenia turbinata TaxID=194707 RepID=A0AAN8ZRM1_9MAGN
MRWVFFETKQQNFISPSQSQPPYFLSQPFFPPPPPPQSVQSDGFNLNEKISPSILLIIIILAIIFFVSGLLHLLVRFLVRTPRRENDDLESVTALQGRLQQLFHLHDAGVDQSFIDTLPVFQYKAIIGLKNPFDCAVCLCEFEGEDKLRLLPKCSHAFHMECIDTWLLSHSTCPLCRASLLPDFSPNNGCSPIVLVLESGRESSREIVADRDSVHANSMARTSSHLGFHGDEELESARIDVSSKSVENLVKTDCNSPPLVISEERVLPVKLGKFRNVDGARGSTSSSNNGISTNNVDARRCFSMGSFAYVLDEESSLQVPIRTPMKKQTSKKSSLPLMPGHRPAMSECGCDSRREFNGFESIGSSVLHGDASVASENGSAVGRSKRDSFSISKIWLRTKKEKPSSTDDSSRRAFSFHFPVHQTPVSDDLKAKNERITRRTISEIDISSWENELGYCDEEIQSCNSLESQPGQPSFTRRTLLWLVGTGRQNKVVHSSSTLNV